MKDVAHLVALRARRKSLMAPAHYDPPPLNWLLHARDYLEVARFAFDRRANLQFDMGGQEPICLLCAHAYELTFKAYLRTTGMAQDKIKNKFGHDLINLYQECLKSGLRSGSSAERDLDILNGMHNSSFIDRYPSSGCIPPDIPKLLSFCNELQDLIEPICRQHLHHWEELRRKASR